jgi:hypothetical protein
MPLLRSAPVEVASDQPHVRQVRTSRADGPAEMKPIGEIEFVNGTATMSESGQYGKSRLCAGIVGHADLRLGDGVARALEAEIAAGDGRFRGIRHSVVWDASEMFSRGRTHSLTL